MDKHDFDPMDQFPVEGSDPNTDDVLRAVENILNERPEDNQDQDWLPDADFLDDEDGNDWLPEADFLEELPEESVFPEDIPAYEPEPVEAPTVCFGSQLSGEEDGALAPQENGDPFDAELDALLGSPLEDMESPAENVEDIIAQAEELLAPEGYQAEPSDFAPAPVEYPGEPAPEEFRDQEYRDIFGDDLDRAFGDVPEEEPQEEQPSGRKKLPKKPQKGSGLLGIPHFLATLLYFAVILAVSVTLARVAWLCADDVLALTKEQQMQTISVTVLDTDTPEIVGQKLVGAGFERKDNMYQYQGENLIAVTILETDDAASIMSKLTKAGFTRNGSHFSFTEEKRIQVTISDTDTMEDIADKLVDAGLVRYSNVFLFYCDFTDAREKISAGTFHLDMTYDYHALVSAMSRSSSNRTEITVTIPEGYNCRQIFSLLEEKGVCTAEELGKAAMEGDYEEYWFLKGVARDGEYCLEGYLFPDTYNFYLSDDPERVIDKMLDDFDYRFRETLQDQIPVLNEYLAEKMRENGYDEDYIAANRLTIREIVIVASPIEKETAGIEESPTIASVIYNRLTNAGNWPYLNIDATILYALGEHKEALTLEDLQIDSPYNTYTYRGLPPGPIANPGLASIQAALNPENTDYYLYVLDKETGMHHFSETKEEHDAFIAEQEDDEQ